MANNTILAGRYRIMKTISNGPRSIIRLAQDLTAGNGNRVIKSSNGTTPKDLRNIRRENAILQKIAHPNVVKRHDYWEDHQGAHLLLEFIPGMTLHDYLKDRQRLAEGEIRNLAIKIAAALGSTHARGYIHADLKPQNIMLYSSRPITRIEKELAIKIIDWETAIPIHKKARVPAWTRAYASPEAWLRKPLDQQHDYYALGVILYECATGRVPFKEGGVIIKEKVLIEPPKVIPNVSGNMNEIILKLLAKAKKSRFPNHRDLLAALSERRFSPIKPPSARTRSAGYGCETGQRASSSPAWCFSEDAITACFLYILLSSLFDSFGWRSFSCNIATGLLTGTLLTFTGEWRHETKPAEILSIVFFSSLGFFAAFCKHYLLADSQLSEYFSTALLSIFIGLCNGIWNIEAQKEVSL